MKVRRSAQLSTFVLALLAAICAQAFAQASRLSVEQKPTPEEALKFLKSMPRVWRNPTGKKKELTQLWESYTVADLKTLKIVHPGGHVEDPTAPNSFSRRHLRISPADWKYFTAFEQMEEFVVAHDMEGITDECLFHVGQFPQTVKTLRLEMSEASGEGIRHLQNLRQLRALSLNFSRTLDDRALVHAAGVASLQYLDVNACPQVTGTGVAALAKLKNLKTLKIGSCSLSDESLQHFNNLPIQELDLSNVEKGWIVDYRGGGRCRFTVTFDGLRRLLANKQNLPNLQRLLLTDTSFTRPQKVQLAELRPGLEVK